VAHYYACKFGLNRLRIDRDIRRKPLSWTIGNFVVIAIYRLRPIQLVVAAAAAVYCIKLVDIISDRSVWQRQVSMVCCWLKLNTSTCPYITLNR